MSRLQSTLSRGYRYAREAGPANALATGRRRFQSQVRIAQLRLIKRWSPVVAVDTKGLRIFVDTRDGGVARQIVLHGPHEADTIRAAVEVVEQLGASRLASRDWVFLDIGANIGTSIIQAICHHGAAGGAAFEPHPGNVRLLRHNLLANDLADRVSVVQCAVTDTCREVELTHSRENSGDHRVKTDVPAFDRFGESCREVIRVPGLSLDSQVDEGLFDIDRVGLVSIDTQGHEGHVLDGASQLCASDVPVMLEYWPYGLRAAGGHDLVHKIVGDSFVRYVDLARPSHGSGLVSHPVKDLRLLDEHLGEIGWADILLLSE